MVGLRCGVLELELRRVRTRDTDEVENPVTIEYHHEGAIHVAVLEERDVHHHEHDDWNEWSQEVTCQLGAHGLKCERMRESTYQRRL